MATMLYETSTYTPAPAGTHAARCTKVIDIGTQDTPFGKKGQFFFEWELAATMDDGRPFTVGKFYSASLHPKATLRELVEALIGPLGKSDFPFDITRLAGGPCLLSIKHAETDSGVRARVASVAALPSEMSPPTAHNEVVVFSMDTPDESVLGKLPDWLVGKIKSAPEWVKREVQPLGQEGLELNDSIPV